jgi:hypothetical protein
MPSEFIPDKIPVNSPQDVKGLKYDEGKPRWDLLPMGEIEEIVKVLTFGAKKYADNSWQEVPRGVERYFASLLRHLVAWRTGNDSDDESGLHPLAHAACNIIFLLYLIRRKK